MAHTIMALPLERMHSYNTSTYVCIVLLVSTTVHVWTYFRRHDCRHMTPTTQSSCLDAPPGIHSSPPYHIIGEWINNWWTKLKRNTSSEWVTFDIDFSIQTFGDYFPFKLYAVCHHQHRHFFPSLLRSSTISASPIREECAEWTAFELQSQK